MNLQHTLSRVLAAALAGLITLLIAACGGSGGSAAPTATPPPNPNLRALSADFFTRKAVAYSGYRGADRTTPPTAAQVLEDMQLLQQGGFNLVRVFGSDERDTGVIMQTLVDHPELDIKVQLGIWIAGPRATHDVANEVEIQKGIALATAHPTIIRAVSVGNETLVDWSSYKIPTADLVHYLVAVRNAVVQPVTTDDNWAVYANVNNQYDTLSLLQVVDFVAMHTYPLSDSVYDPAFDQWRHPTVPANERAAAMMNTMIDKAKADYQAVRNYMVSQGAGATPVVIGETGWKAVGPSANRDHPANQKMYYERLAAWTDGPRQIFYFEAFDEPWKGGDDGWGLFDVNRKARYVIHGLYPANVQDGTNFTDADAVYFVPQAANPTITAERYYLFADTVSSGAAQPAGPNTPLTTWLGWDVPASASGAIVTTDTDEGANALEITPIPKSWGWGFFLNLANPDDLSNFNNANARLNFSIKTTYAGQLEIGFFTGSAASGTGVDVYLPISPGQYGYQNDGAWHTVSIPVATIAARAAPAFGQPNSATLNMALLSQGFVIADRYAVTGNAAGATTHIRIDNIYWAQTSDTTPPPTSTPVRINFDETTPPMLTLFGSNTGSASVANDPTNSSNKVAMIVKAADAELWAGATVSTGANLSIPTLAFTSTNKTVTLRVYSSVVGATIRLKVEDAANSAHSIETDAVTTQANAWETLTFNFTNNVSGTPAFDPTFTYNRVSVFPNFGVTGATAGAQTYYFDDFAFVP